MIPSNSKPDEKILIGGFRVALKLFVNRFFCAQRVKERAFTKCGTPLVYAGQLRLIMNDDAKIAEEAPFILPH